MINFDILFSRMLYGKIVVIKRSGADGAQFPLTTSNCLFGRYMEVESFKQLHTRERILIFFKQVTSFSLQEVSFSHHLEVHHLLTFYIVFFSRNTDVLKNSKNILL